jgi:DNA-binding CsgD family transcriptional regulator
MDKPSGSLSEIFADKISGKSFLRRQQQKEELEHERQLAAIRTQSHALVWTGTPDDLMAIITQWYRSGRIVAESLQDALQKASIHFLSPDGTLIILPSVKPSTTPESPSSKASEGRKTGGSERPKKQDLSRYLDIAGLTDKQYQCASLRWEYSLSVSEIARKLRISRATVSQHIAYAQRKMRSSGLYEKVKKGLSKVRPEE